LTKANQFLALDPAYPELATIGGIVATADTNSLRQRYGGVRDMLLGLSFVRADGQTAKAGGRVVKNVAGYDLMKLFTGSYGTLGILSQVTFRVYPLPETSQTVVLTGEVEAIAKTVATLQSSALTPTAMDLLSTQVMKSLDLGKGMGLVVQFQSVTASVQEQTARTLAVGQALALSSTVYAEADETELWQRLRDCLGFSVPDQQIACKIGVRPSEAVATLTEIDTRLSGVGLIHAGSGLGWLIFDSQICPPEALLELRSLCAAKGGFLSILQAAIALKQQVDVWGYPGNALGLMRGLKQQFDPDNLFSPHRFVGGI
jgi:glycolate oxidase FAD binding subunit